MFRRHPDIPDSDNGPARRRLLERGPAAVFFVATGPLLAGVVEQPLTDILPDRLGSGQPDGVGLLDLDGAATAAAGDPQQVSLNVGQPLRPDGRSGRHGVCVGGDVVQDGPPILRRQLFGRADYRRRRRARFRG
jgi:hypothetical protein